MLINSLPPFGSTPFPTAKKKPHFDKLRQTISHAHRMDETLLVNQLLEQFPLTSCLDQEDVSGLARDLISEVRAHLKERPVIQQFMQHYDLTTVEGVMLMSLAEALLRIPDAPTRDLLIRDKLSGIYWNNEVNANESALISWATWGLALSGKLLKRPLEYNRARAIWQKLIQKCSEPIVRQAIDEAIKWLSEQFVLGKTMDLALKAAAPMEVKGYLYSFDMLGEVARTMDDANRYFSVYQEAINTLSAHPSRVHTSTERDVMQKAGISVKLSALYPRYEPTQAEWAVPFLIEKVQKLAELAMRANINLILDAEEADRLEMSLDIFSGVLTQKQFSEWKGLGLAVQAYQKRCAAVIDWIIQLARQHQRNIPIRLVKGAYWDSEIKQSQAGGYEGYPVFTRKAATDLNYIVCAKKMLMATDVIYAQFATHNAYSVAAILQIAHIEKITTFEFQSLQGMGREIHDYLLREGYRCRIYAPVGPYRDLLPYLVRRLLENGANNSFVNQVVDLKVSLNDLIRNPAEILRQVKTIPHPKIPLPQALFAPERTNSPGLDISNYLTLIELNQKLETYFDQQWNALVFSSKKSDSKRDLEQAIMIRNPADNTDIVGRMWAADDYEIEQAIITASQAFPSWRDKAVKERVLCIKKASDLIKENQIELIALLMREAGKTLLDSVAEIREAIDFCRYYSAGAEQLLRCRTQRGITGESNTLELQARGCIACISPWNFPVSIFTGQIVAALVTGNTVLAKPAEQTSLVAARMIALFYQAGIPEEVLHFLPGSGERVGAALTTHPKISSVVFTGGTDTAGLILRNLSERPGPIATLIAETGGINAMVVDSSALPEQVVADVIASAFNCAGQRCSSLRILCLQEDIAEITITMLKGAMAELRIGNPKKMSIDVGPVIDIEAKNKLYAQSQFWRNNATLVYETPLSEACQRGYFVAPQAFEISDLSLMTHEVFGPILPIYRYQREKLDELLETINSFGYGLTFGLHTRIKTTQDYISQRISVGNIYINRNMIGAVVESQPFGGHRLSGTGPKAGGPHYLARFCTEKTISNNTTALGGNTTLMSLK